MSLFFFSLLNCLLRLWPLQKCSDEGADRFGWDSVRSAPHSSLNTSKGTVYVLEFFRYCAEELMPELVSLGVITVHRLKKRNENFLVDSAVCFLLLEVLSPLHQFMATAWSFFLHELRRARPRFWMQCHLHPPPAGGWRGGGPIPEHQKRTGTRWGASRR